MRISRRALWRLAMGVLPIVSIPTASAGDAETGAALFRQCAPCHSLVPGRNMTGPSLAGLWGRKAGSLPSFERYSPALKSSNVVWDQKALDAWLRSPKSLISGNHMVFPGMPNAEQRSDLIAFLKQVSAGGGMQTVASSGFQNLKKLGADHQVQAIRYCHDTYHVTTADGQITDFWEVNLRFKTDLTDTGPLAGKPVILRAGMMGDRASMFFANPEEISAFIKNQC